MKKDFLLFFLGSYLNMLCAVSSQRGGKEGFNLFCRPRRRPVKPRHLEFFNTAEKFTVMYDNKKIQAYRWGNGPKKLLLLHGWESHSYWWKSVITNLPKEKYSIYSIDAPGHGLSEGHFINLPYYSKLIEKIVVEYGEFYALLGHSLGAFSTVYTFCRAPQLGKAKLIIMASPGEAAEFVTFYKNMLGLSDRTMSAMRAYFMERTGFVPEYFSLKEFVKSVNNQGLIIHDQADREAPYAHALAAHHNWPNSKMISTTGLGHNLKSLELIQEVENFLNA
ncbi:MAG: alpha/beta hydrolase [Bacteroidetes bacterium]|nr:alpha/beta hydrolase [Bacteroidota bacterium]MBS1539492.1 alpha/beta hydrolase [Bacteroidota bacterium]